MAIFEEKCYVITCDCCGDILDDGGYTLFVDESSAHESADCADWIEHEGKNYCPKCYEIDDNDNITIKKDRLEDKGETTE